MYIKNRRCSAELKAFSSYQTLCFTKSWCFEIAYFSYTNRWWLLKYNKTLNQKKLWKLKKHFWQH